MNLILMAAMMALVLLLMHRRGGHDPGVRTSAPHSGSGRPGFLIPGFLSHQRSPSIPRVLSQA